MSVGAWGLAVVGLAAWIAWTWAHATAGAGAGARVISAHPVALACPLPAEGIGSPGMGLYLNPDGTLSGSVSMMAGSWDKVGGPRAWVASGVHVLAT